jgi:hypothetical protein
MNAHAAQKQEEEVKSTLKLMWAAIENNDIELYASFIHPDFTQFGESDPTLLVGKENGKWLCTHGHYTLLGNE